MTIKNLYKTVKDGMIFYSPEGEGTVEKWRVIADEGKGITDGETVTTCVDTRNPEAWSDCDAPPEPTPEEEATSEDYENALERFGATDDEK